MPRVAEKIPVATYPSLLLGKAGEMRVASELLLRGHRPCVNLIDTGCDIWLESGISIQVKTAKFGNSKRPRDRKVYHFSLHHWSRTKAATLLVDFLIFWGVDTDQFWVLPAKKVEGLKALSITTDGVKPMQGPKAGKFYFDRAEYEERWDLLLRPTLYRKG